MEEIKILSSELSDCLGQQRENRLNRLYIAPADLQARRHANFTTMLLSFLA